MTYLRKIDVKFQDSPNLDAFARVRMSTPQTIFDSKQLNDKQPLFWYDQLVSGAGGASTYNANSFAVSFDGSSSTLQIDSIDGSSPSSNSDLYDKLIALIA